jgi:hypothetical protein
MLPKAGRMGGFLGGCDGGSKVIGSDGSAIHSKRMVMRRQGRLMMDICGIRSIYSY